MAIDNGLPVGVLYGFVQYNSGISFLSSTATDLGSILSVDWLSSFGENCVPVKIDTTFEFFHWRDDHKLLHISRLLPLAQCPVCQCGNGRPFNECMQFLTCLSAVDDTLYILTMSISRVMSGQPTFLGHFLVRGNEEWWVFLPSTCDRLVRNWLLFVQHNKNNLIIL